MTPEQQARKQIDRQLEQAGRAAAICSRSTCASCSSVGCLCFHATLGGNVGCIPPSSVSNSAAGSDLNKEQARALKNKRQPILGYLTKLKRRMVFKGFRPDDRLLTAVVEAEAAMHTLWADVHYLSGGDVVGRRR